MTLGSCSSDDSGVTQADQSEVMFAYIILCCAPLMSATGNHLLRSLKQTHEFTSAFYVNTFTLVSSYIYNVLTETSNREGVLGLKYEFANFDIYSWLMVLTMANAALTSSILKSAAM